MKTFIRGLSSDGHITQARTNGRDGRHTVLLSPNLLWRGRTYRERNGSVRTVVPHPNAVVLPVRALFRLKAARRACSAERARTRVSTWNVRRARSAQRRAFSRRAAARDTGDRPAPPSGYHNLPKSPRVGASCCKAVLGGVHLSRGFDIWLKNFHSLR